MASGTQLTGSMHCRETNILLIADMLLRAALQIKLPRPHTAELIADAAGVEELLQGQVRGAGQLGARPEVRARRRRQRERHAPQLRRFCGEGADNLCKIVVCLAC